jgi:hypothetical protein
MTAAYSLAIEESGSDHYSSLEAAFTAALPSLAALLAERIRLGLDSGRYVIQNGVVKLPEEAGDHAG